MVWHPVQNFPVYCDPHSQRLWHSQESRIRCFSGTLLLFPWSKGCCQFDLWFLCLSKDSLNIWKYIVHILLKPGLENFKHYFTSVWDECNCAVVWALFDISFLWDWYENWPFPVWNQSVVPCPVLTVASSPAYRFLERQVRWSGHKKECIWVSHSEVDEPRAYYTEWSRSER